MSYRIKSRRVEILRVRRKELMDYESLVGSSYVHEPQAEYDGEQTRCGGLVDTQIRDRSQLSLILDDTGQPRHRVDPIYRAARAGVPALGPV